MSDVIERLKAVLPPIHKVVPRLTKKSANEWSGPCPMCGGKDRFTVFRDSGRYMCRQCTPKGDDVIAFHCWDQDTDIKGLAAKYLGQQEAPNISKIENGRRVTGRYDYHDESGAPIYWKERVEPGRNGRSKEFFFYHGDKKPGRGHDSVLYHLHEVVKTDAVIICEGEKHCDLLRSWGLTATTLDSGAQSKPTPAMIEHLAGKLIIILRDNDTPGLAYAETLAKALHGKCPGLKVILLPDLPDKGDLLDWVQVPGNNKDALLDIIRATPEWTPSSASDGAGAVEVPETETWGEPLLFGEIDTPDIPCNLLPGYLGEYCKAVAKATQTPEGLAVMMGLATVAACLQKRIEVAPFQDDYREPVNLWTVTGLDPGNRKTAVKTALTEPLTAYEAMHAETMRPLIKKVSITRDVNLKRVEQLKAKAAKPDTPDKDREGYQAEIFQILDETPEEIKAPRLWIDDVTPERLQDLMAENGERIALISDEGGIFEVMAGLYNNGRVNMNVFLQAHAGASIRVDRQCRAVTLYHPALSFGLAVQPDVIADLSQGNKTRFRGNGTLARFLYCIPRSTIGRRDVARRSSIPETIKAKYHTGISSLLGIEPLFDEHGREQARILTLTPDALQSWISFSQYIESRQGPDGEFYAFQDWTSKLPGAALRIAGLFHVVEHGAGVPAIDRQTIERALDLCDLLISHARRAFEIMGTDQAFEDAKVIFRWIIDNRLDSFTQRDCLKKHEGRLKRVERLTKALLVLTERHIISEPIKRRANKEAGRPGISFKVNPTIYTEGVRV